jgi:pyrrolidone-carboxylate peptidase
MHQIKQQDKPTLAGFIHLPALPEEAEKSEEFMPSLSLDLDLKAARLIVNYLAQEYS